MVAIAVGEQVKRRKSQWLGKKISSTIDKGLGWIGANKEACYSCTSVG